jgi:hypothetical protein
MLTRKWILPRASCHEQHRHNAFYKPNIVITRDFSGGSSTSFESLIIFL